MDNTKTIIRFFTVADYLEEEEWLREQHRSGWKLIKMTLPAFYLFEKCIPEDVIYRLDFKNNEQGEDYLQMVADFGWEYFASCAGWLYFRKPAREAATEADAEIFSDNVSRLNMVEHIVKTRILPLLCIFLCVVIPNLLRSFGMSGSDILAGVLSGVFGVLFAIYVFLLVYCSVKLKKIRDSLE